MPPAPSAPPTPLQVFSAIFDIATIVLLSIMERIHRLSLAQTFDFLQKGVLCAYRVTAVQVTLIRAPERFTMAELRRLAQAARFINRLAGKELNFSALLTGSADVSSASPLKRPNPANPSSNNPQSKGEDSVGLRDRNPQSKLQSPRCIAILSHPGATLARIFQQLVALDSRLPADPTLPSSAPTPAPTLSASSSTPTPVDISSVAPSPDAYAPAPPTHARPALANGPQDPPPAPPKQLPIRAVSTPCSPACAAFTGSLRRELASASSPSPVSLRQRLARSASRPFRPPPR